MAILSAFRLKLSLLEHKTFGIDRTTPKHINMIRTILKQPFQPLDESSRAYVLVSSDGYYILKLLKNPKGIDAQFRKWFINLATVPWSPKPGDRFGSARILYNRSIASYELAWKKLRRETRLVYVHTKRTHFLKTTLQINGKKFKADTTPFLLQEKVELLGDRIESLMNTKRTSEARHCLDELLDLILAISKKGIVEDTFNFTTNYGYTRDNKLICLDVGEFHTGKKAVRAEFDDQKIIKKDSFRWLAKHYPVLADYLIQQTKKRLI